MSYWVITWCDHWPDWGQTDNCTVYTLCLTGRTPLGSDRHDRTMIGTCNHFVWLVGLCSTIQEAKQGYSGAGTRRNAVPANIFEPERCSGKYLSQPERWYCSVPADQLVVYESYLTHEIWPIGWQEKHWNCCYQMSYFKAKMHQISIPAGAPPQTPGSIQRSPQTP